MAIYLHSSSIDPCRKSCFKHTTIHVPVVEWFDCGRATCIIGYAVWLVWEGIQPVRCLQSVASFAYNNLSGRQQIVVANKRIGAGHFLCQPAQKLVSGPWWMMSYIVHLGDEYRNRYFNPFTPVLSGSLILLKITLEWSIDSQNIWRGVVDKVLMNNSPSNIFWIFHLLKRYHQNCQAVLADTGMNGLLSPYLNITKTFLGSYLKEWKCHFTPTCNSSWNNL